MNTGIPLNPNQTFNNFNLLNSNQFAYQFACPHCTKAIISGLYFNIEAGTDQASKNRKIITTVLNYFSIKEDALLRSRSRIVHLPRKIAMYLLRRHTDMGYREIGALLQKDYATVIHGINSIEKQLSSDPELQKALSKMNDQLL